MGTTRAINREGAKWNILGSVVSGAGGALSWEFGHEGLAIYLFIFSFVFALEYLVWANHQYDKKGNRFEVD